MILEESARYPNVETFHFPIVPIHPDHEKGQVDALEMVQAVVAQSVVAEEIGVGTGLLRLHAVVVGKEHHAVGKVVVVESDLEVEVAFDGPWEAAFDVPFALVEGVEAVLVRPSRAAGLLAYAVGDVAFHSCVDPFQNCVPYHFHRIHLHAFPYHDPLDQILELHAYHYRSHFVR